MAAAKLSGIYEIVNTVNGKRYVGSAASIKRRWQDHVSYLKRGAHHNVPLQRAWDRYGDTAFEFRVIETCEAPDLLMREQVHIDELAPEYNVCKKAGSSAGIKHSDEARANMSAAQKFRFSKPEARAALLEIVRRPENRARSSAVHKGNAYSKGKPRPKHVREKISAALAGTKHHQTDWAVYSIQNSDGAVLSGIQIDLRKKTGLSGPELCGLIKGNRRSAKGWRLAPI